MLRNGVYHFYELVSQMNGVALLDEHDFVVVIDKDKQRHVM